MQLKCFALLAAPRLLIILILIIFTSTLCRSEMIAVLGNDDSVLPCITRFYVDLVCFSIKEKESPKKSLWIDIHYVYL